MFDDTLAQNQAFNYLILGIQEHNNNLFLFDFVAKSKAIQFLTGMDIYQMGYKEVCKAVDTFLAGKEQVFALGGQEITEDVPDGVKVFSPDAPLGQALMGHRAGDTVSYEAPNGRKIQAEIVKVERV